MSSAGSIPPAIPSFPPTLNQLLSKLFCVYYLLFTLYYFRHNCFYLGLLLITPILPPSPSRPSSAQVDFLQSHFSAKSFSSMLVVEQVGTFGDGSSRTRDQPSRYHYGFIAPHEQSISDGMDKLIVIKRGRSQAAGLVKGPSAACLRASSTAWAKP